VAETAVFVPVTSVGAAGPADGGVASAGNT